jgi:hypothetical protein
MPPDFADLYYDATSLLLTKIASVASVGEGGGYRVNALPL